MHSCRNGAYEVALKFLHAARWSLWDIAVSLSNGTGRQPDWLSTRLRQAANHCRTLEKNVAVMLPVVNTNAAQFWLCYCPGTHGGQAGDPRNVVLTRVY